MKRRSALGDLGLAPRAKLDDAPPRARSRRLRIASRGEDPEVQGDRDSVEAALRDLAARGLVDSRRAESGETGREAEIVDWWVMTDACWELLGLIRSPRYR
jgi:hypothetical protein